MTPWWKWMGNDAMRKSHVLVCAATLVTAAVVACSAPAIPAGQDGAEDEIRLPPSSKSAKNDGGAFDAGGAREPEDDEVPPLPEAGSNGTLCDISTASGGPAGSALPATPLPACGNPAAFNSTAVEQEIGSYSGPGSPRAACSPTDIATLAANIKNPAATTWADYRPGLSAECEACVFSKTTDTRWGVVVLIAADTTRGFSNFGACHAAVNESAECGRAFQYDQFCLNQICGGCQGATKTTCVNSAWGQGGACSQAHAAVLAKCGKLAGSNKLCGTQLAEHAKIVCGGC